MNLSYKDEHSLCLHTLKKAAGGAKGGSITLATDTVASSLVGSWLG